MNSSACQHQADGQRGLIDEKCPPVILNHNQHVIVNQTTTAGTLASIGNQMQLNRIIKPTFKRYLILFLFCINSANKSYQWIQISAGTKKITYYYDVENFVINATSVLFMLSFVVLSAPTCYLIEHIGIRKAILIGSSGIAAGAITKCFSCYEGGIYTLFVGQVIVSISEQFVFSIPARLVSVWFPDRQVSIALAMSILGQQLGVALGFMIPQMMLNNCETKEQIGLALYWMFLGTAILSVCVLFTNYLVFDEAPKYAPGAARLKQIDKERQTSELELNLAAKMRGLWREFGKLMQNKHFTILTIIYGIIIGLGYTVSTILNQMLEPIWPGDDLLIGHTGFIFIVSGAIGSAIWGQLLDKTRRYLQINLAITVGIMVAVAIFGYVVSFMDSRLCIYLGAGLLGFFLTGFMVSGMELAVELTYPAPELVTSSFMNVQPQIFGTAFVFIASYIADTYGALATNIFYLICVLVALILLLNIQETLKRQKAVVEKTKANRMMSISDNKVDSLPIY